MSEGKRPAFFPAFYARYPVTQLSRQEMDAALAAGHYRNGTEFCCTSARSLGKKWTSCVMLRLPITGFEFKKRHRKLLRVNNGLFRIAFQPFVPTSEKETLWQCYKSKVHEWGTVPELTTHLLRGQPAAHFNMWEICVYDGSKLVAFSAFDLGLTSLASLEAAYDPDYAKYSLGFYTMLLEIEFCRQEQLRYYYPGFFPKDDPMFHYKLRPGEPEFFRLKTGQWLPFSKLGEQDWLMEIVLEKLQKVKELLLRAGFSAVDGTSLCVNAPSEYQTITSSNLHIIVPIIGEGLAFRLFISWDVQTDNYWVFNGSGIHPALPNPPRNHHFLFKIDSSTYHGRFDEAEEVLQFAQNIWEFAKDAVV